MTGLQTQKLLNHQLRRRNWRRNSLGNKDYAKLYELLDIVTEIDSLKENPTYSTLLAYFDSSSGVNPIVAKLPHSIQEKWITEASNHKLRSGTPYQAFPVFVAFLEKITRIKNDPSLQFETAQDANRCEQLRAFPGRTQGRKNSPTVSAFKTQVRVQNSGVYYDDSTPAPDCCPIHEKSKHSLNKCHSFRLRPFDERRTFIKENGHCFRCCGPRKHIRTKCRETVLFSVCKATDHPSALHQDLAASLATRKNHEGEKPPVISSICTHICGKPANTSKSCAEIVKAIVYPELKPNRVRYLYCIIDDQSSNTLATSPLFDHFHEYGPDHLNTLKSCSGESVNSGRKARGYYSNYQTS